MEFDLKLVPHALPDTLTHTDGERERERERLKQGGVTNTRFACTESIS